MQQRGLNSPSASQLIAKYRVNIPGKVEVIWQPLYDYQATVAAATASQLFFQVPIGQATKTLNDTNMDLPGQLPKGQMFAVTGIQVDFYPDLEITNVVEDDQFVNDTYDFYRQGNLNFHIGSKDYLRQGNLMKFPPVNRLAGFAAAGAATTTAATDFQEYTKYAMAAGREFEVRDLVLESTQNFSIDIQNRLAVSTTGRVGVTLNGWLFRNAQ